MQCFSDARPRIGARRARIPFFLATLALGAVCLTASGFAVRAAADEPASPQGQSAFAGSWEGKVPNVPLGANGESTTALPPARVSVEIVKGEPKVYLTRYKMQVVWDGSVHFVPVQQSSLDAEIQGETLTFRIHRDALALSAWTSEPADTAWKLELTGQKSGVLTPLDSAASTQVPLEVRWTPFSPNSVGC